MTGISISCASIASSSSRMTCSIRWCTRQPAGMNVHSPVPTWRTSPARTISLCEGASASAGGCFSVGRGYRERRVMGRRPGSLVRKNHRSNPDRRRPMSYEVPALPYGYDALEPHIDEATMRVHHDKHHQAYVDKANGALAGTEWEDKAIEEVLRDLSSLPADKRTVVRNNGGGHFNHSLFWESMSPD